MDDDYQSGYPDEPEFATRVVVNLKTGEEWYYTNDFTAEECVQLAYQQGTLKDYNWWLQRTKDRTPPAQRVKNGVVWCGDWATLDRRRA